MDNRIVTIQVLNNANIFHVYLFVVKKIPTINFHVYKKKMK